MNNPSSCSDSCWFSFCIFFSAIFETTRLDPLWALKGLAFGCQCSSSVPCGGIYTESFSLFVHVPHESEANRHVRHRCLRHLAARSEAGKPNGMQLPLSGHHVAQSLHLLSQLPESGRSAFCSGSCHGRVDVRPVSWIRPNSVAYHEWTESASILPFAFFFFFLNPCWF